MPADGNGHHTRILHFTHAPQRVVSLVPSLTESLFDLGLGQSLVGITDYCIHPAESTARLPRLGGPKNPRVSDITALHPDLVLANWEENPRSVIETLEAYGLPVWITFPQSVAESMEVLWKLVELFRIPQMAAARLKTLEVTLDWTISAAPERRISFFCPIWYSEDEPGQPWWMTFNAKTYCHSLLDLLGGQNSFANRLRRYPLSADLGLEPAEDAGERDTRYPRVTLNEIRAAQPEVILLPDEPYPFDENHREQIMALLPDVPAVQKGRVHLVTGSLITWHGTRLAHALRELPALLDITGAP